MKKQMIGSVPSNVLGMMADLSHKLQHGSIHPDELASFLRRKNPFGNEFYKSQFKEWEELFKTISKEETYSVDFDRLRVPKRVPGFERLLIIPQGIFLQSLFNSFDNDFGCITKIKEFDMGSPFFHENEESLLPRVNMRRVPHSYAIWVKDTAETDMTPLKEQLKHLPKHKSEYQVMNLIERFLFEAQYFKETGNHLDCDHQTICNLESFNETIPADYDSSEPHLSCYMPGGVYPLVSWHQGKLCLDYCQPKVSSSSLYLLEGENANFRLVIR